MSSELYSKPNERNFELDNHATDYKSRFPSQDKETNQVSQPAMSYRVHKGGPMEPLIHTANYGQQSVQRISEVFEPAKIPHTTRALQSD